MKTTTISIIGTGAVGSTTAYALLMQRLAAHIQLVDINTKKCDGHVRDLSDAQPFFATSSVVSTDFKTAGQADIIIIAAGKRQEPGQSRLDLLVDNRKIICDILSSMKPINRQAVVIMVTNPVDVLSYVAYQTLELPHTQIIGSGTLLDTQRLKRFIAAELAVAEQSIDAFVIGEHGDSQVIPWSRCYIAGVPLTALLSEKQRDEIAQATKTEVQKIIACKGFTNFGVAACVARTVQALVYDQSAILPVSTYIEKWDTYLSMPAVLGAGGIKRIIDLSLSDKDEQQLNDSATALKQSYQESC